MSENYEHQGIFTFTQDDFDRATRSSSIRQEDQDHQIRRAEDPTVVVGGLGSASAVYETAGMLSEMFNFGVGASGGDNILDHHHHHQHPPMQPPQGYRTGTEQHLNHITGMSTTTAAESAAAMQLFLTHPQHRSPSPPLAHHHHQPAAPSDSRSNTTSGPHLLLPNNQSAGSIHHGYHDESINQNPQFTWINHAESSHNHVSGVGEGGQSLSLSLSSSLHRLDVTKAEEIDGSAGAAGMLFFGSNHPHQGVASSSTNSSHFKDLEVVAAAHQHHQQQQHMMQQQLQSGGGGGGSGLMGHLHHHPFHLGFGPTPSPSTPSSSSSLAVVNFLRNSRYTRPTLELLEEFCSVGRGYNLINKKGKLARNNSNNATSTSGGGGGNDPSSSNSATNKDIPPLSPADRMEHQRRKVKLLSMLDEVERRYSHYCEQMQMVMNSFDLVMGFGAAAPYTALAQKAMSRHFRCLKDAIQGQLKHSCELLGEKDVTGSSGLSKGETPRLKVLEQSLRQQRAFHQMGMMDQEAWRPQRGLPERSVNVLRAWLFEHFLHPYPNDADKHLLARQTGLSRNQVSNWFINARVRLWKPMVEEMYQQEAKERERAAAAAAGGSHDHHERDDEKLEAEEDDADDEDDVLTANLIHSTIIATTTTSAVTTAMNALTECDPSYDHAAAAVGKHTAAASTITRHRQDFSFSENQAGVTTTLGAAGTNGSSIGAAMVGPATNADEFIQTITAGHVEACNDYGTTSAAAGFAAYHHHHLHQGEVVLLGNAAAHHHQANSSGSDGLGPTLIRFGTSGVVPTGGDVSLTLGLRHGSGAGGNSGGNASLEKSSTNAFSFGDFGS